MSKLYIGNISYNTSEETLKEVFSEDGRSVIRVQVIKDRETGQSRGFAFIEMGSPADAEAALSAHDGRNVDGRDIRVSEARERAPRTGGPGGGGGARDFGGGGGARDFGGGGGGDGGDRDRGRGRGRGKGRGIRGGGDY